MARLKMLDEPFLTDGHRIVIDEVVSGKRGKIPAPMIAWLRNPELARRSQHLGELLRFDTSLEPSLSELAILVCARHWTSHHEWTAHKKIALAAGLDPDVIDGIAKRRKPQFEGLKTKTVYEISLSLLARGKLEKGLYDLGITVLGEKTLVELVALLGYYSMVALTLNTFEIGLPENEAAELLSKA